MEIQFNNHKIILIGEFINHKIILIGGIPRESIKYRGPRPHIPRQISNMNMGNPLIPGTIQKIYEQGPTAVESPCLQVIHLKNFEKGDNVLRYK